MTSTEELKNRRRSPIRGTRLGRVMHDRLDYATYHVVIITFWEAMTQCFDKNGKPFSDQAIVCSFKDTFGIEEDDLPDETARTIITRYKRDRMKKRGE